MNIYQQYFPGKNFGSNRVCPHLLGYLGLRKLVQKDYIEKVCNFYFLTI